MRQTVKGSLLKGEKKVNTAVLSDEEKADAERAKRTYNKIVGLTVVFLFGWMAHALASILL